MHSGCSAYDKLVRFRRLSGRLAEVAHGKGKPLHQVKAPTHDAAVKESGAHSAQEFESWGEDGSYQVFGRSNIALRVQNVYRAPF